MNAGGLSKRIVDQADETGGINRGLGYVGAGSYDYGEPFVLPL